MRQRGHNLSKFKLLIASFLVILLLFVLRSSFSNNDQDYSAPISKTHVGKHSNLVSKSEMSNHSQFGSKIPPFLAQVIIHYSTSTVTPQQTLKEISITSKILSKKSPCNFLVFGLGHDSLMWSALNYNGKTIFLEEDKAWIEQIRLRFPMLETYHVTYNSRVNEADNLFEVGKGPECTAIADTRYSMCQLALKGLPNEVYETEWDIIMVDAPTGYYDEAPGRMTAIYTAGMIARNRADGEMDVLVHDVNREIEDKFSREFLCVGYMRNQEGRLRHFKIPSHRGSIDKPFCP